MSDPTDAKLLDRIRQGDQGALGDLLERHQKRLYAIAMRMIGRRDDAAEVTQEAMLKIVEHIHDYHGQSQVTTWMIRIVMNLAISFLRRSKLRRTVSLDAPGPAPGNGSENAMGTEDQLTRLRLEISTAKYSREPNPADRVQEKEMLLRLERSLGRLDDDLRAVLVLRDLDQMEYPDIALALSIPVGTVKSRLFRARLALRQEMQRPGVVEEETEPVCLDSVTTRDLRRPLPTPQPQAPTVPPPPPG